MKLATSDGTTSALEKCMFYLFLGQPWTNAYTNQQLAITIQMQASLTNIQSKFFVNQLKFTTFFSNRKEA